MPMSILEMRYIALSEDKLLAQEKISLESKRIY